MNQEAEIYDLGEVGAGTDRPVRPSIPHQTARSVPARRVDPVPRTTERSISFNLPGSLSLFVPGAGHFVRGEPAKGAFFIISIGFLAALGWAIVDTMDRLAGTLEVFGYSPAIAVWTLGVIYAAATALYVGSVLSAEAAATDWPREYRPHPVLAASASLLLPGWGQVLNGTRARAAMFLVCLWLVGASWLLVSPPAQQILRDLGLQLPDALRLFTTPATRWTLPALVWTLAVYDATVTAANRRRD